MRVPVVLEHTSLILNRVIGGKKGWTVCATLYNRRLEGKVGGRTMVYIVDRLFFFDKQHCRKSFLRRVKSS